MREGLLHISASSLPEYTWKEGDKYADNWSIKIDALIEIIKHHLGKDGWQPLSLKKEGVNELVPNPEYLSGGKKELPKQSKELG